MDATIIAAVVLLIVIPKVNAKKVDNNQNMESSVASNDSKETQTTKKSSEVNADQDKNQKTSENASTKAGTLAIQVSEFFDVFDKMSGSGKKEDKMTEEEKELSNSSFMTFFG